MIHLPRKPKAYQAQRAHHQTPRQKECPWRSRLEETWREEQPFKTQRSPRPIKTCRWEKVTIKSRPEKKKKRFFQLQKWNSTATGCPSNQYRRKETSITKHWPNHWRSQPERGGTFQDTTNSPEVVSVGVLYQTPEWSQEERIGNPHKTVGEIPS